MINIMKEENGGQTLTKSSNIGKENQEQKWHDFSSKTKNEECDFSSKINEDMFFVWKQE